MSKGGGYFLKTPDCGIVIDPGFNFIDNFITAGHKFNEIDHVIITHAHNDHTADLESILIVLHEYNEAVLGDGHPSDANRTTIIQDIRDCIQDVSNMPNEEEIEKRAKRELAASPRRKRIRIYMSASTFKIFAPRFDLYKTSDYDIVIIKETEKLPIRPPNQNDGPYRSDLTITAISAKHNDLQSDRDSLGFVFHSESKNYVLVYTGDTGYDSEIEDQYKELKVKYSAYNVILLAHLGGFKDYEKNFAAEKEMEMNWGSFYKNHLGRLGLARLVEVLEPEICIISEFGEEFKNSRLKLAEAFEKVYTDTSFIPADIGLRIRANKSIQMISEIDYEKNELVYRYCQYKETAVYEEESSGSLLYFNKNSVDEDKLGKFLKDNPQVSRSIMRR